VVDRFVSRVAGRRADLRNIGERAIIVCRVLPPLAAPVRQVRELRLEHRRLQRIEVGYNSRLDALQAAVLEAKLPHLADWSSKRREHAAYYDRAFADVPEIRTPTIDAGNESIYNQYTVRADRRDGLQAYLKGRGIGSAIYYPLPLHLQPCF